MLRDDPASDPTFIVHSLADELSTKWPYPSGVPYQDSGVVGGIPSRLQLPVGFWEIILLALVESGILESLYAGLRNWLGRLFARRTVRRVAEDAVSRFYGTAGSAIDPRRDPDQAPHVARGAEKAVMDWTATLSRDQLKQVEAACRRASGGPAL